MGCQDVQAVPSPVSPGSPSVCPHASNRLPFTNLTPAVPSHLIVGLEADLHRLCHSLVAQNSRRLRCDPCNAGIGGARHDRPREG
jgi:hypothetical protein